MPRDLSRPSFTSPFYAWIRQGGKEAAQALPAFPNSIKVVEEPGTLGNPTQQMVTEESGALRERKNILDRFDSRNLERGDRDIDR
jgi:hypothetical protein